MPWKECHAMDERIRFVARLLEGEKMMPLCKEFGISRKTGYSLFSRYKDCGVAAFTDRSRRPYRQANRLGNHAVLLRHLTQIRAGRLDPIAGHYAFTDEERRPLASCRSGSPRLGCSAPARSRRIRLPARNGRWSDQSPAR